MKKILNFVIALTFVLVLLPLTVSATATPSFDDTATGGYTKFFANGVAITVEAKDFDVTGKTLDTINVITSENADAIIVYGDKYVYADSKTVVFGGSKLQDVVSSSITINGGTIYDVFGGGQGSASVSGDVDTVAINLNGGYAESIAAGGSLYSTVKNATINMTGGVTGNVYGGGFNNTQGYDGATIAVGGVEHPEDSLNKTLNTVINVSGGRVHGVAGYGLLFAGGLGYSYVGTSTVNISGTFGKADDYTYVTSAGANGRTDKATVNVSAGTIQVFQGVNRGSVGEANVNITGGNIETLYVGGETSDANVTGVIEKIVYDITGGAIETLEIGKSGGVEIPANTPEFYVYYDEDVIDISSEDLETFGSILSPYIDENTVAVLPQENVISTEVLETAKENEKGIAYADPAERYLLRIAGTDITDPTIEMDTRVTISETIPETVEEDLSTLIPEGVEPLYLDFAHNGDLPGKTKVTINLTDMYEAGDKVFIAHFNEETNKLEWIGEFTVTTEFDIPVVSFDITECSVYTLTSTALVENPTPAPTPTPSPNTGDSLLTYVGLGIVSIILLSSAVVYKKRFNA